MAGIHISGAFEGESLGLDLLGRGTLLLSELVPSRTEFR
jgi:hypothetical protein